MSSILKALRRLEEERARKSHVAPEIAASLLRHDTRRRPASLWIWPTVLSFVALVLVAFFWLWQPAPLVTQMVTTAPSSVPVPSVSPVERGGEVIIEEVMDQRRPVVLPAPVHTVAAPALLPAKVDPPPARVEPGVLSPAQGNKPATAFIEERQSPVISAIAWQDDSAARMAVVEGLPVMTGEFVGTAKVQEILRDRILFVEAGRIFSVSIDPQ
jgi:hypothetical protein